MIYRAEILAEAVVASEHLEAAAGSIMQLADSMGIQADPDITLSTIPDDLLALNSRGQVDRTVIDAIPYDDSLRVLVTARDLGAGDSESSPLNYVFGTSRLGRVVVSTLRVRTSDDFGSLVLHEAGHAEGLVQLSARNYNRFSGFGGHCVNQCLMLPGNSYADMQSMVTRYRSSAPFCGDCSDFLLGRPRLPW